jgi:phenylalanyl-tRNA synthetase beta chain
MDHQVQARETVSISLNISAMNAFAGMEIPEDMAVKILQNLGFSVTGSNGNYTVLVPGWRNDVSIAVDLYEEVMRIYGFDQIAFSGKMQVSLGNFEGLKRRKLENKLRSYLVSQGVFEASTNSLTSNLWWPADESLVELSNPLSSDMGVMRKSLIPGLLNSVAFNRNRQAEKVWLFELGRCYEKSENGFKETQVLSMVLWGKNKVESWESPQENTGYFDIKQLCSGLLKSLSSSMLIDDISIEMVSKDWLKKADIQGVVWSIEIPLKKLLKQGKKELKYQAPAKFPSMRRDLSLVVDSTMMGRFCGMESLKSPKFLNSLKTRKS